MNKLSKLFIQLNIIIFGVIACGNIGADNTSALELDKGCRPVESVFARGSGQTMGDVSYDRFEGQVEKRLDQDKVNFYELGTEDYGGGRYPAVGVGWDHPIVSSGSWLSAGEGFKYGGSVNNGKKEFKAPWEYPPMTNVETPYSSLVDIPRVPK